MAVRPAGCGHDMDHYADDLAALTAHLDLKSAVHVGHSSRLLQTDFTET